jgi:hypothetical protein
MTMLRPFTAEEQREKDAWVEHLRRTMTDIGVGVSDQLAGTRADIEAFEFMEYEGVKLGDEVLYRKGGLFVFGDTFVREWGAQWHVQEDGAHRDYVIAHPAFPEPVILRLLHEYCATEEFEELAKDGEPVTYAADGKVLEYANVLGWAHEALVGWINAHRRGRREFWDKKTWRQDVPFSIGVETFPPL